MIACCGPEIQKPAIQVAGFFYCSVANRFYSCLNEFVGLATAALKQMNPAVVIDMTNKINNGKMYTSSPGVTWKAKVDSHLSAAK